MRNVLYLSLVLSAACGAARERSATMPLAPHPDVTVEAPPNEPRLAYEAPYGWHEIAPISDRDSTVVAVVTLERPELQGMMVLTIITSEGLTPLQHAERLHAQFRLLMPDVLISDAATAYDGPHEASFVYRDPIVDTSDSHVRKGKSIFRAISGDPDHLVKCEGWWPASSHEFLLSPLHRACESVSLGK